LERGKFGGRRGRGFGEAFLEAFSEVWMGGGVGRVTTGKPERIIGEELGMAGGNEEVFWAMLCVRRFVVEIVSI